MILMLGKLVNLFQLDNKLLLWKVF